MKNLKSNIYFLIIAIFSVSLFVSCESQISEERSDNTLENILENAEIRTYAEDEINDALESAKENINISKTRKAIDTGGDDAASYHRKVDVFVDLLPKDNPDGMVDTRWTWCFAEGEGCTDWVNYLQAYFISYNIIHIWVEQCDNYRDGPCRS